MFSRRVSSARPDNSDSPKNPNLRSGVFVQTMHQGEPATSFVQALLRYETEHVPARNLAARTRSEYHADLCQAIEFLGGELGLSDVAAVERGHLEAFLAELDRRGLSGSSRRRKLASLRSFFTYLNDVELIPHNPTSKLTPPARERPERRALSEAEYQQLQLACSHDVRDSAIIELILQTGLRLSEVTAVRLPDLEVPTRIAKDGPPGAILVHGKGRKERTVTLNWKACKALKSWLAIRPTIDDDHLFVSKFREPLGRRGIQRLISHYLKEAGITDASTHTLRHTFATHSAKKGTKLAVLQRALGHESLDTTSIYVEMAR